MLPSAMHYSDAPEDVDLEQLERLRRQASFPPLSLETLAAQLRGSRWVVSAWDEARLVGFARAISDGVTNAYVATVVVDEACRGRGIGRAVIERLIAGHDAVRFVLHARREAMTFYARLGFAGAPDMMWRDRLRKP